jgi:hypothetical protein
MDRLLHGEIQVREARSVQAEKMTLQAEKMTPIPRAP